MWNKNRPKHVPTHVRIEALERDQHRCTATLTNGHRCGETTRLEAAHWGRWTPGEQTTVDMVRILCHWHHNRETQREAAQARRKPSAVHPTEQHPGLR